MERLWSWLKGGILAVWNYVRIPAAILAVVALLAETFWVLWLAVSPIWIAVYVVALGFLALLGFNQVSETDRWVVEVFRKYSRTVEPGAIWLFPLVETVRKQVSTKVQQLPLFVEKPDQDPIEIETKAGGIIPDESSFVFVVLDDKDSEAARKLTYTYDDVVKAITTFVEGKLEKYFKDLDIEDALKCTGSVHLLLPPDDLAAIKEMLAGTGLRLDVSGIQIRDFELPGDVKAARNEVVDMEQKRTIAGINADIESQGTVGILVQNLARASGKSLADVQAWLATPAGEESGRQLFKMAQELQVLRISADSGSLSDIRFSGLPKEGGLATLVAGIIAALRGNGGGGGAPGGGAGGGGAASPNAALQAAIDRDKEIAANLAANLAAKKAAEKK